MISLVNCYHRSQVKLCHKMKLQWTIYWNGHVNNSALAPSTNKLGLVWKLFSQYKSGEEMTGNIGQILTTCTNTDLTWIKCTCTEFHVKLDIPLESAWTCLYMDGCIWKFRCKSIFSDFHFHKESEPNSSQLKHFFLSTVNGFVKCMKCES